jgi:transcriptional regulator NrdR family protein
MKCPFCKTPMKLQQSRSAQLTTGPIIYRVYNCRGATCAKRIRTAERIDKELGRSAYHGIKLCSAV